MNSNLPRIVSTLVVALAFIGSGASANDIAASKPTFHKDILPILQENCQTCHRSNGNNMGGMIAPMSLISYTEVRPWAKAMAKQVAARTMPPWHAAPERAYC